MSELEVTPLASPPTSTPWVPVWKTDPTAVPLDLAYRGAYSAGTSYKDGDVVAYNGSLYLCVNTTIGNPPEDWGIASPGDTGWTTMTLTAAATQYAAPYGPCQFRKLGNGMVVCQGIMTLVTPGGTVTTFPAGYRPTTGRDLIFSCASSGTAPETFRVDYTGRMIVSAALGVGVFVSVMGVSFFAEN